jgi:hypothetical protein
MELGLFLEVGIALIGCAITIEHADSIAYAQGNCGSVVVIFTPVSKFALEDFRKLSTALPTNR